MEFQVNAAGKRIFPSQFKTKVLEGLRAGATAHESSRKYGVGTENIIHRKKIEQSAVLGKGNEPKSEEMVPASEY